ncbi:hypothetical protein [Gracilibacillus salitolerans]|uniref:hypothetical protein n=1 Tax=Gracilibacillus salitolerans TaxID=2663022 RepID=UPI001E419925|nr:hypothetical protein [Gracilibacillus salitolerans]
MSETIFKATNVSKIYGINKVLDKVSIEINRGMIYGLIGENDAGKSTFMCKWDNPLKHQHFIQN